MPTIQKKVKEFYDLKDFPQSAALSDALFRVRDFEFVNMSELKVLIGDLIHDPDDPLNEVLAWIDAQGFLDTDEVWLWGYFSGKE